MPRPGRRRRGCLIGLLITLVVIIALVIVADRVSAAVAEDQIAQKVAAQAQSQGIALGEQPTADIGGFPFLTQVLGGEYDQVTVKLRKLTAKTSDDREVPISKLDVTAKTVHADLDTVLNGGGSINADSVTGVGTVDYSYLQQIVSSNLDSKDLTITAKNGQLQVKGTVTIHGYPVKVTCQASVTAADNAIKINIDKVTADGDVPSYLQSALNGLAKEFSTTVNLPTMPYSLKLQTARAADDGLEVRVGGNNVALTGSAGAK